MLHKKSLLISGSFLLPFFLLGILWFILNLAPFGPNNLLVSDLGTQYMPFLSAFKTFFQGGAPSLYSFSDALGGNLLSLSAYYLLSPFNLIVFAFSYEQLPIAILLIITLKISFMGSTMFYYLEKTYTKISMGTLAFSTAYSLCGFVTVYCLNFMWLDALLLLPLLILGIQSLWSEKKYGLYCFSLFLAIVTNYYMGYMLCLFSVCYSIYWYCHLNSFPQKNLIFNFFKRGRLFFITSFFTGISTSFILLPAMEGMLATKKTSFNLDTFLPLPTFNFDFFSQLSLGSVNFDLRLEHLPTIFSGTLIVLLVIIYFQLCAIPKKEKFYAGCLLGAVFLSFWIELINTVWHMFQSPAGFPYRNSFIFSFLLIKFAYEAYLKLADGEKLPRFSPIIFSALLMIGLAALKVSKHSDYIVSAYYGLVTLLLIWFFYGLIFLIQKKELKKYITIILLFITCGELMFNFWISMHAIPFGNQSLFSKTYTDQKQTISDLKTTDATLYRIKQTIDPTLAGYNEINNGYNNPMLYDYPGVSSYTSTLDAETQETLTTLGLYQKNDRRIAYVDESKVINFLLNVRYQLTPETKQNKKKLSESATTMVYENKEAIGIGYLVPESFRSVSLSEGSPLINQEKLLQSIMPSKQPYFEDLYSVDWVESNKQSYTLTAKTMAEGDVYLYIPNFNWNNMNVFKVNEEVITPTVYIATNQLFNLGYFKKGEQIQLQFDSQIEMNSSAIKLQLLNENLFDRLVENQRAQTIQLTEHPSGTLTGNIIVADKEQFLYLAIPYDKKWEIFVDGTAIAPQKIFGNFIGIPLTDGTHEIKMHYQQRTFFLGLFITSSVFLLVFLYHLVKNFFKKTKDS